MTSPSANPSEIKVADSQHSWIDRLPARARDFAVLARWDRPIGTWLLLLPCWFGQALAPGQPDIWLMFCFAVGAIAMRGAGCTINDMVDRKFDAMVERTRNRPIAAGRVSMTAAVLFTGAQMLVGLLVLTQIGLFAAIVAFASVPLIVTYPFMKRFTYWPQIFLGVTFNWGILVGYAAEAQSLGLAMLVLYLGSIAWTVGYDTIYAHQDKDDDILVGVKSSALALADRSIPAIRIFYAIFWLAVLAAGILSAQGVLFYVALLPFAWLLHRNVANLDTASTRDCLKRFRANRDIGLALVAALVLGGLVV
jgi:4-hydroxybenzoate polyprenyltransferase